MEYTITYRSPLGEILLASDGEAVTGLWFDIAEGQFAPGSMLPKVEAAMKFAQSKPQRKCIITSLEKAVDALNGVAGTTVSL